MVKYDRIRHVLFWLAPEARKLSIRGCLQCIDILTDSLAGPYIPAVLPQSGQLSDDFHSLSRPMLLGEALGVLFHPYPSTTCAANMAQCPLWLCLSSFESRSVSSAGTAGSTATCGADADRSGDIHRIAWFARSSGRHQLAVRLLRQLLAPNSILQDDAILLRSLLQVESSRKVLPDGQLESETVAGKRAYSAAKRWLSGQTESLEIWIGFAALEARRGRYSQALQVWLLVCSSIVVWSACQYCAQALRMLGSLINNNQLFSAGAEHGHERHRCERRIQAALSMVSCPVSGSHRICSFWRPSAQLHRLFCSRFVSLQNLARLRA